MYRSGTRISILTGLVTGTTLALAYVFVGIRGLQGTINPGGVVLVIGAFTSVSGTLSNISSTFVAVDQHTTFLEDYFSFLSIDPLVPVPVKPNQLAEGAVNGIEFKDVGFITNSPYDNGHCNELAKPEQQDPCDEEEHPECPARIERSWKALGRLRLTT